MSIFVNAFVTSPTSASSEAPNTMLPAFCVGERDLSDAALHDHLKDFLRFTTEQSQYRGTASNSATIALQQHIRDTCCEYAFMRHDGYAPWELTEFEQWAQLRNAIFYLPDGGIYNAQGIDLLSPDTPLDAVPLSKESLSRRNRVRSLLWKQGIHVDPSHPPVRGEYELSARQPEEIFNRAIALTVVATIASAVTRQEFIDIDAIKAGSTRTFSSITPREQLFINTVSAHITNTANSSVTYPASLQAEALQLQWGYVTAETLAWLLSLNDINVFEQKVADVPHLRSTLRSVDKQGLDPHIFPLRPIDLVCDAAEHVNSLLWFYKNNTGETTGAHSTTGYDASILLERHRALTWAFHPYSDYDSLRVEIQ